MHASATVFLFVRCSRFFCLFRMHEPICTQKARAARIRIVKHARTLGGALTAAAFGCLAIVGLVRADSIAPRPPTMPGVDPACSYMSAQASTGAELPIKSTLSGPALALAHVPAAGLLRAWIPDQASTTGLLVSVEANGVEVHGTVDTNTPLFFPQRAFVFNDVVIPTSFHPIADVLSARRAQVTVAGPTIPNFLPAQPLRATVGCNSLGLVRRSFDMRPAGTTVASGFQFATLRPNQNVQVSVTAHGPSAGTFRVAPEDHQSAIEILSDHDPSMTRIVAPSLEGEVIGWVPTASLNIHRGGYGGPTGSTSGRSGAPRRPGETFSCPNPLTLSARIAAQSSEIGRLDANVTITRLRREASGASVISLPSTASWLSVPPGVELLVSACP